MGRVSKAGYWNPNLTHYFGIKFYIEMESK
jgi:hypothetical protein